MQRIPTQQYPYREKQYTQATNTAFLLHQPPLSTKHFFAIHIGHDNSLCSLYALNNKRGNYMQAIEYENLAVILVNTLKATVQMIFLSALLLPVCRITLLTDMEDGFYRVKYQQSAFKIAVAGLSLCFKTLVFQGKQPIIYPSNSPLFLILLCLTHLQTYSSRLIYYSSLPLMTSWSGLSYQKLSQLVS